MTFCRDYLKERQRLGLRREIAETEPLDAVRVLRRGRECLLLCGNDYLGMAQQPAVIEAACAAMRRHGAGAGGSRLISGSHPSCQALEDALADWKKTEAALVFSSGYAANVGIITALAGPGDLIFSDRLNHASIIDGCRLSGAKIIVYDHADMTDLEAKLAAAPPSGRRLIVSDGVFSMDGDIASLDRIAALGEAYDALVMVDDAHALGILGEGRGSAQHFGVGDRVAIQMGTLSKSLGSVGGYVAASAELIEYILNRARSFIFSTALPPAVTAAALAGIGLLQEDSGMVKKLQANSLLLRNLLQEEGLPVPDGITPIIPLIVGEASNALLLAELLEDEGILASAVRPPTVPEGESRLRLTVSAAHSEAQLTWAAAKIAECWRKITG